MNHFHFVHSFYRLSYSVDCYAYCNRDNRLRQSNYVQYPHPLFPANSVRGGIFHWKQEPNRVSSFKNGHLRPLYDNFINTLYISSVRYWVSAPSIERFELQTPIDFCFGYLCTELVYVLLRLFLYLYSYTPRLVNMFTDGHIKGQTFLSPSPRAPYSCT